MDGLSFGFSVLVIGFTVVCITLLLLNIIFHYLGYFFEYSQKKRDLAESEKKTFTEKVRKKDELKYPEEKEEMKEGEIPPEVAAVIMGVIASFEGQPEYRLRVRKVKRERSISPWVIMGRRNVIKGYGRDIV